MTGTTTITELSEAQRQAAERIDALDLEPIAFKLMHPEPGQATMTLAEADQLTAAYRCFLKLCAWYPGQPIVPSRTIDQVWHAHILDTSKYRADTEQAFGYFLGHFPYFGLRGADDEAAMRAAYDRTRDLFAAHFGIVPDGGAGDCSDGGLCVPEGTKCDKRADGLPSGKAGQSCSTSCQAGTGQGTQCSESGCHNSASADMDQARPRPDRSTATA